MPSNVLKTIYVMLFVMIDFFLFMRTKFYIITIELSNIIKDIQNNL